MSEARSPWCEIQVVTLLFCNLGSHDPHTPLHTILQMIFQVPIEDLVGVKGSNGFPNHRLLNKLT